MPIQIDQSILNLMATLSMTTGGMSMVFLIFCVDQLTHLRDLSHPGEVETAKFSASKYLMALVIAGLSSVIFLVIGFLVVFDFQRPTITPTQFELIFGLFYYAVACLVFMILFVTAFEFIEQREGQRRKNKSNQGA